MGPSIRLVRTADIEAKRPLGRPGNGRKDDISMGLTEIWHRLDSASSGWAPVTYL
jgi:hypothetical protein